MARPMKIGWDDDRARSGVQNLSYASDFLGVLSLPCKNAKKPH